MGIVFSCGWLPPCEATALFASVKVFTPVKAVEYIVSLPVSAPGMTLLPGVLVLAALVVAKTGWVCAGICAVVTVTLSVPLNWPMTRGVRP